MTEPKAEKAPEKAPVKVQRVAEAAPEPVETVRVACPPFHVVEAEGYLITPQGTEIPADKLEAVVTAAKRSKIHIREV